MVGIGLLGVGGVATLAARAASPDDVTSITLPYAGRINGGWSGVDVSPDGARFWAVTDAGKRTEGRLLREDGGLTGIDAPPPKVLRGLRGRAMMLEVSDSEGIDVRASDGQVHISFEGFARLRRYDGPEATALWLPDPPPAASKSTNQGLEAVARDAEGRLYTLPEATDNGAPFPLLRLVPQERIDLAEWETAGWLSRDRLWLATGADFGPDGALYLLERRFLPLGFSSRIRRFVLGASTPDTPLTGEVVYASPTGRHGNLEGIGIWRDPEGRLRALMVADDNHRSYQRSEMVEVVLPPLASGALGQ